MEERGEKRIGINQINGAGGGGGRREKERKKDRKKRIFDSHALKLGEAGGNNRRRFRAS